MGSIKLPHASGNSVSIAAPQSNPASDRTLYLPDTADGTVLTDSTPGTIIQTVVKYHTQTAQLASSSGIHELDTDLRLSITPKYASSKLLFEVYAPFFFPNSANLQYAYIYDVTNSAVVAQPPASGSRARNHWVNRNGPVDDNDADLMNFKVVDDASNTTARTYTIYHGTEGAAAQFYASTLSSAAGSTYPAVFTIQEIAQ